ncbi:Uncharacterized protein Rs2_27435 [Raphanus sativus]|uniref:Uncharacterized protein LOC130496174 n=1 Tax=Raphanus sativus TaxID=3726 RepID=A0A9W3BXD1_RAPSA|nr:uncharacterized protein LOC130496174 [Raphanus sativus]KAJ4887687.1 Uncharacterized protein Rs2_27435 [Raphanus sativus]
MDRSEIINQFLKLRESFAKKDYKLWVDLWPAFEMNFKDFVGRHGSTPLPDPDYDFFEGFEPTDTEELVAEFASASLLLPSPVNKAPPPPPVNDSAAAPDGISQRLSEAHRLAEEAFVMVNTLSLDGSIRLNRDSVAHLEGCQTNITAATEALQLATNLLSEARSISSKMSR